GGDDTGVPAEASGYRGKGAHRPRQLDRSIAERAGEAVAGVGIGAAEADEQEAAGRRVEISRAADDLLGRAPVAHVREVRVVVVRAEVLERAARPQRVARHDDTEEGARSASRAGDAA